MAQEIELKLSLAETEQTRFRCSPVLRHALRRSTEPLLNLYYDTPDLALHRNGIALRLRRSGRRWLQTVKCAGLSQGGLSSRPEWEGPYGGHFDFAAVDDSATRKRLDRLKQRLGPVFETNFRRTTWVMREASSELAVALDFGTIIAAGRVVAISEVEIELVSGKVADIFALADRLGQHFQLTPSLCSKAERGYRLFLDAQDRPVRALPVALAGAMLPAAAFGQIALSCLNHLQHNYYGAVHSGETEYIHQMRVALRRLRAALRLFRSVVPEEASEQLLPLLRNLTRVLGAARDLDVLTTEIVAPVVAALPEDPRIAALASLVAERRHRARLQAVELLGAPGYGRLLLQVMARLNGLDAGEPQEAIPDLATFANAQIKRLQRKTRHLAATARLTDPASLHALRIAIKRQRYAVEFFVPLLPARRAVTLIRHLTKSQDQLGQLNDLANAGAMLMDCAGEDAGLREAVSLIGGWHGQRYASLLAGIPKLIAKLHKVRSP